LSNSKYAKALEQTSLEHALKGLPEKDMAFLRSTIHYISTLRSHFVEQCSQDFSEDEDEKVFARKYCSLLICICSNYEIFIIEKSEQSQQLFTLLKDCASARNLRITVQSLDFWYQFHETITTRLIDAVKERGGDMAAFLR
jgi:hypothetical protein